MGHTMRYLATDCATRESVRKPSYVRNLQFVKDIQSTTTQLPSKYIYLRPFYF